MQSNISHRGSIRSITKNRGDIKTSAGPERECQKITSSVGVVRLPAIKPVRDRYDYVVASRNVYPFYKKVIGELKVKPRACAYDIYHKMEEEIQDIFGDETESFSESYYDAEDDVYCVTKRFAPPDFTVFPVFWLKYLSNSDLPLFGIEGNKLMGLYRLSLDFLTVFYRYSGIQMWKDNIISCVLDYVSQEDLEDDLKENLLLYDQWQSIADELCRELDIKEFDKQFAAFKPITKLEKEMIKLFSEGISIVKEHGSLLDLVVENYGGSGEVFPTAYYQIVHQWNDPVVQKYYELLEETEQECGTDYFTQKFTIDISPEADNNFQVSTAPVTIKQFIDKFNQFINDKFAKLYSEAQSYHLRHR